MNCIILHGCPRDNEKARSPERRTYDKHWMPWLKERLEANSIPTTRPLMPDPWNRDYETFKKRFEEEKITEDTIIVAHSCGCAFIVRWLGETKRRLKKILLVAPWKIASEEKKVEFYDFEIDRTIPARVPRIVMFTSNDEEPDGKKSLEIYKEALGGEIINLKDHGHFLLSDMGTEEFPELLEQVLYPDIEIE